ncbi:hypothetical protein GIY62_14820 [Burkholderia plantarii]|uniref:DUF7940 domain-containing protein n=1 Tax=Burkholderia plantarii TaxID=41899 RepID=UPI00272ABCA2|nr:hypothetical protein [Burkholderia plantarii]WLE58400.1 hypothetical protein GIY62_14820 [Burkholderia plantarii]
MGTMKIQLIDEWRRAHRFGSVQLSAGLAAVFGAGPALFDAWRMVPDDLKDALPHGWPRVIATVGFLLVLGARLVQVKGKADGAQ